MAEKEEIIFIDLIKGGCAKCPHEYGNCKRCYYRQEAIERIAKAFWPWNYTPSEIQSGKGWETMTEWERGGWLGLAKSALNALLGEK